MQTTMIYSDGNSLKVNRSLRKWLGPQRKFVGIVDGDNLIIKKTHSLLDFAVSPDEDFLSLEEIAEEIRKSRNKNECSR